MALYFFTSVTISLSTATLHTPMHRNPSVKHLLSPDQWLVWLTKPTSLRIYAPNAPGPHGPNVPLLGRRRCHAHTKEGGHMRETSRGMVLGDESSGGRGDKAWHDVSGFLTHVCGPLGCRRPPAACRPPPTAGAGSHTSRTAARTSGSTTWERSSQRQGHMGGGTFKGSTGVRGDAHLTSKAQLIRPCAVPRTRRRLRGSSRIHSSSLPLPP